MEFIFSIIFIGYILWNIFIIMSSDFSDEQFDIYFECAECAPIPAFILAYFLGMLLLELKDGDSCLIALSAAAAYMSPLFAYCIANFCSKVKKS